jgi:GT2 family glycosyltransferase
VIGVGRELMVHFQSAKEPFFSDAETNELLRLRLQFSANNPEKNRKRTKLHQSIIDTLVKDLQNNPGGFATAYKVGEKIKKYFPIWFKISIKRALNILPHQIAAGEFFEFNLHGPLVLENGFGLQTSKEPLVSIIIPVHNHIATSLKLLNQFRINEDVTRYEIIVVDDASTDATQKTLSKIRGIKVLTHLSNVGYLRATNSAVQYCEGKYICLLNNDTVPQSGWLDALVRTLKSDPNIAIAGSMLLTEEGQVAEAGSQIFRNHEIWNLGRLAELRNKLFSFTREVEYCSAAAILVDGAFFRSLDGFDERYIPAYYEDADLAITAWSQGRKVVYVHDSYVYHIEGVSHGRDTSQGLKAYQLLNKEKFWDKWEKRIDLPWTQDEIPRFEADRDSRGIVVFVDNFVPSLTSSAGASRAYKIIEALRLLKFHVIVIPNNPLSEILNREQLRRKGVEVYQSYDEALSNLKMRTERIKCFWISRIDIYEVAFPRVRVDFPGVPVFFDTVDLHHLREERNIALLGKQAAIYDSDIKKTELSACASADTVIVVSDYEKDYLTQQNRALKVRKLFMPHNSSSQALRSHSGEFLLFVGNFDHTPNIDAVEWLIDEILTKTLDEKSDPLRLKIVGKGLPDSILQKVDGIKIQYDGWQESLDHYYAKARIVVVPIRFGAGKKGKLGEAVMNNCPIVTTSIGVEGYPLQNEIDCLIADTTEEFAHAISRLWGNPKLASQIASSSKLKISEEGSFNSFVATVEEIMEIGDNELLKQTY